MKGLPKEDSTLVEEIVRKTVSAASGCQFFLGGKDRDGYGSLYYHGKKYRAHRLIFQLKNGGDLETWQHVCHRCDNPQCVNVEHLFLGNQLLNNLDKISKGRDHQTVKTHCPHGHEYSAENTVIYDGKRYCKTCRAKRNKNRSR